MEVEVMRYLKLFESFSSIEDLVQDTKDICLELNDANIRTVCQYNHPYVLNSELHTGFITIGMERIEFEDDDMDYGLAGDLEWHEVEEVVDRLIDYFESNNWSLKKTIKCLVYDSFRKNNFTKNGRTESIIGVSFLEFKEYIESKFQEGMSWVNHGEWHLDHIIPISMAKNEQKVIELNHYSNFQPLWAKDNLKKSNKIDE